jgi:hypothetical protein
LFSHSQGHSLPREHWPRIADDIIRHARAA